MKKDTTPLTDAEINKTNKIFQERVPIICCIAAAAPVLVFEMQYRETKDKPITNMFVAPTKKRKPFLSVLEMLFPRTAACPLPSPGRKPQRGEAITEPKIGFNIFIFGEVISWVGI